MPERPRLPSLRQLARRLRSERWIVDRARQTAPARRLRVAVERVRVRALVRREGSTDAALDRIVADALAAAEPSGADSTAEPERS